MQVVKSYPDNVFCWVDLTTPDQDGAKAFYTALFGWEADDRPIPMGGTYTMLQLHGKNVAGLGGMQPEMKAQGMPAFWASYVKHDDVDSVAAKIAEAGGNLMFPPMDVMDSGRMTMGMDATGAAFGVWQPQEHTGAELVNMPNTLVWNELQSRQPEVAKAFYESVFGWESKADENGYVTFAVDGRMQAGMIKIGGQTSPITGRFTSWWKTLRRNLPWPRNWAAWSLCPPRKRVKWAASPSSAIRRAGCLTSCRLRGR